MIETFLTAYDPSDLPGASIDPLGFERGYLFLADKILPGLTNVASRPRYFAVLCAGAALYKCSADESPRELRRVRQDVILRFERYWVLANVLARPEVSGGIRGVTYAQAYATDLRRRHASRTKGDYRLLLRQTQYGVIGVYGSVADGLRFLNRDDFTLTPALGDMVAEAFLEETAMPSSLRRAIVEDSEVSLSTLEDWGKRAHVDAPIKSGEADCLRDALHGNDVRSRMATLLHDHQRREEGESELDRLGRIERTLNCTGDHADLREAITCLLAYEACYRYALLAFERLLWLSRQHSGATVTLKELAGDPVVRSVKEKLPRHANQLTAALDSASTPRFRENLDRLADVRRFLEEIVGSVIDHADFIEALISRHTDIQRGKFDRGRRKMPWLERINDRVSLTMTRAGGSAREISKPEQIIAHPYRLGAADALLNATATTN